MERLLIYKLDNTQEQISNISKDIVILRRNQKRNARNQKLCNKNQ
jgi:hypothetical protein